MLLDNLLSDDISHLLNMSLDAVFEEVDIFKNLTMDDSEYECVDGEEGDYGTIRYFNSKNQLVVTFINNGGDDVDYELTALGKRIVRDSIMRNVLDKALDIFDSGKYIWE